MRRYLLVLDMDLLALDEELDLQPINYLVERHEQERGEIVVLSLAATRQAKLSRLEFAPGRRHASTSRPPRGSTPWRPGRATTSTPPQSTV